MGLVSPVSLEGTAPVLKYTLSSSCRVPSRAVVGFISCVFSPTRRRCFHGVPRGCPSLQHGGVLGCGSPGQARPQNYPGLSEGLVWPCRGCIKQQQLLIASDVSEHQLASCCMERHQHMAGATAEGCLSPSPLPSVALGRWPWGQRHSEEPRRAMGCPRLQVSPRVGFAGRLQGRGELQHGGASLWAVTCAPHRDCHPTCCGLGTHSQWGIGDLAGGTCPNTTPPPEPGFGVQPAETQCCWCPSRVGDASGGHAQGVKARRGES